MKVGTPARKSIRRPVALMSGADGEPPIVVTPRQVAIFKMIGAAVGGVPVAILLLLFYSNSGQASYDGRAAVAAEQLDPAAADVARVKAEAEADGRGKAGTFFTSCTSMPSGDEYYHELRYQNGRVRDSSATKCAPR